MFQYVLIDLLVESIIQQETGMMTPIGKLIFMMGVAQLRIGRGKFTGFTSTVYFDGKQLMVEKKNRIPIFQWMKASLYERRFFSHKDRGNPSLLNLGVTEPSLRALPGAEPASLS